LDALAHTPPWTRTATWVHGDLYARHLVLGDRDDLAGIIDWGDLHAGDPALDLSIAFSMFEPELREPFFRAYGEVDADTLARARFRALHYGVLLWDYGLEVGDATLVQVGEEALRLALAPERQTKTATFPIED
jgi:aminoglycoside phosphotransferase (APT) family kinase protein